MRPRDYLQQIKHVATFGEDRDLDILATLVRAFASQLSNLRIYSDSETLKMIREHEMTAQFIENNCATIHMARKLLKEKKYF